jgi:hypothetical protein
VESLILEKCLLALAKLFLEASKKAKSVIMLRGALQMLGIAHVDQLVGFWSSEVNPKIGTL